MKNSSADWTWAFFPGVGFGRGLVVCQGQRIARVWLPLPKDRSEELAAARDEFQTRRGVPVHRGGAAAEAGKRLEALFSDGVAVDDLAVEWPEDCPPYMGRVLEVCRSIPVGSTLTYAELARRAGNAPAVRAAGNAMARNPLPLVVPCHRVVPSGGGLGSYGGGVAMKRWLLEKEGALAGAPAC